MIFQQSEFELPEGVCCMDTLATLKRRAHNYFKLPIINNTNSNITLSNNTEIGRLEYINSITSFDVHVKEQQQACVNRYIQYQQKHSNLKEHQKQNSANDSSSANSEKIN